ncbi:MAG: hypothetical protein KIG36_06845 [Eubacteriales bacterium]|nr:hypothetical protein [Eubacteriales bacterium]
MNEKETAVRLLRDAAARLSDQNRYPRRSDLSDADVAFIKAHLGPWPRALEAAGLKPPRDEAAHLEKIRQKRIRARVRRRSAKLELLSKKNTEDHPL